MQIVPRKCILSPLPTICILFINSFNVDKLLKILYKFIRVGNFCWCKLS